MSRPFDYDSLHKDGLYVRCVCGAKWSEHTASIPMAHTGCRQYRPYIEQPLVSGERVPFDRERNNKALGDWIDGIIADEKSRERYDFDDITPEFKHSHSYTISRALLTAIAACGIKDFPRETCGFILGDEVSDVRHITNTNRYGNGSYTMDPLQQIAVLKEVENGKKLKVVFHSHPNMGAFFSSIDRDAARSIDQEQPDWPETVWIVMSIKTEWHHRHHSKPFRHRTEPFLAEARAYLWNPAIKDFSEITLTVVG